MTAFPFMYRLLADDCKTILDEFEVDIEAHAVARYGIDPRLEIDAIWMGFDERVNVLKQTDPMVRSLALSIANQAEEDEVLQEQVFVAEGFYRTRENEWVQGVAA